jgi:predicted tellurium resistance membrane protein TerC
MTLVVFGIGLSIPIVVWGSGLLARLMNRFAWIIWLGGGILGYVAIEMMIHDKALIPWVGEHPIWAKPASITVAVIVAALGWWFARKAAATSPHLVEDP